MKRQYFGTDGVRGPYGGSVINETFAARLGFAAATRARKAGQGDGRVLIGRDTRGSGQRLLHALAAGIAAAGLRPVSLGILPTPAVARAVLTGGASLGVVITASHNPAADNGIKFFSAGGSKLVDEDECEIEALLPDDTSAFLAGMPASGPATLVAGEDGIMDYCAALSRLLPARSLAGWKIVLDTANGATCLTSAAVLRGLGAEVVPLGDRPDGANINAGVGSEHPEAMAAAVRATGARLGVAHDGDGDRCVLCDETGAVLDGDELLTILATHALARGRLAQNTLVITVQSNLGVDRAVQAAGGRILRTPVGDRYVLEQMRRTGANLGGESSGHIVCSDVSPTGDGLVAALSILGVMRETGRPLSGLRRILQKFPQGTRNLRVRERRPLEELPGLAAAIGSIEKRLAGRGRVLVRFSGTEARLRLLVEAPDEAETLRGLEELEAAARQELAVL
ncbi:phosphoglucosamine mutase [Opitutaceae bacterium TAV5]|nr:phosphoglucosamine mutase [Opitutaceae bacterium TAV5]